MGQDGEKAAGLPAAGGGSSDMLSNMSTGTVASATGSPADSSLAQPGAPFARPIEMSALTKSLPHAGAPTAASRSQVRKESPKLIVKMWVEPPLVRWYPDHQEA